MKNVVLFICLLPMQLILPQPISSTYWGLNLSTSLLFEQNTSNDYEMLPPPEIYLHFGHTFNQFIDVDIFAGYITFADNWDGIDMGAAVKSLVIDKFYISVGLNYNPISGGSGEGNQAPIYYKKDFLFCDLGIRYFIDKKAFWELNYSIPLNSNKTYGYNNETVKQLKLISKLKLDFGWNFPF